VSRTRTAALGACLLLGSWAVPVRAGQHTWRVSEVFSNAKGTIQYVELKESQGGDSEGGVGNGSIASSTKNFSWSHGVLANTANKYYLVATQAFAALPGAPTPDVIISAGNLPFFFAPGGDSVSYSVYDTCTFGAIPTDGTHSYDCLTASTGLNSPTNFAGATGSVTAAITLGHVDDFQDGTVQLWSGNANPTNIASGGPAGVSDRYLRLSPAFLPGPLGAYNNVQWSGNYLAAGVGQMGFALDNFGPDPVNLRVMLFTPGCSFGSGTCTVWATTNALTLAPGSGWVSATFSLAQADLTRVTGSDSYAASLANVDRLLIRHDAGPASPNGSASPVTATLGIDNVTALPEPALALGLAAGAALVGALLGRRRS
jgi:hypothetical protein